MCVHPKIRMIRYFFGLSKSDRNVPRLWDLKGGYQHCKNLLMVLSLDNFLQVCAQLSTDKNDQRSFPMGKKR